VRSIEPRTEKSHSNDTSGYDTDDYDDDDDDDDDNLTPWSRILLEYLSVARDNWNLKYPENLKCYNSH